MKIGIFGGTFSPPHIGHINAAKMFLQQISLDKLIVIPCGIPPHKQIDGKSTNEDRLNMSRICFSKFAEVSDFEISKEGKSFTVDTLKHFASVYPNDDLYLLIGDDMLFSFNTWKDPDIICSLANVCYICRGANESELKEKADEFSKIYNGNFISIKSSPIIISSSDIRDNINLKEYLTKETLEYIKEHKLYK